MAYPEPDVLIVVSPSKQRVGEIRLFYSHASGGAQLTGYLPEETEALDHAIMLADPRYGDNPEAAMMHLENSGFKLYGKLFRRTFSIAEASDHLDLSRQRVQQFIADGRLSVAKDEQDNPVVPYKIYASSVLQLEQQERPAHRPHKG